MTSVTISKKLIGKDVVIVPRKEYEAFSNWRKMFKIFKPTAQEKAALKRARVNYRAGRTMTFDELKHKLAVKD